MPSKASQLAHLQAGVDGQQQLPDKFLIQRTSTTEPPLGILLERDIDVESSLLDRRKVLMLFTAFCVIQNTQVL